MDSQKILIVEDDPNIRELLLLKFKQEKFTVCALEDGLKILGQIRTFRPDLIVLDIMLPFKNGFEILKELKENPETAEIPVFFLTAKTEEEDVLKGFEYGAGDYLKKPFSPRELIARIRNILKERTPPETGKIYFGGICIDLEKMKAEIRGKSIKLTVSELTILSIFLEKPDHPFSRGQIIDKLRGPEYAVTERTVDVLISGLRKKISDSDCKITSVRGLGYRLVSK